MGRLGLLALLATGEVGWSLSMPDADFVRYAMGQGALFILLLVVLWFYRRDFQQVFDRDAQRLEVLTGLVQANTAAMVQMNDSQAQHRDATHRLARAVEHLEDRIQR